MSMYSDWDLVYGLTYQALNRKLARIFYQQRSQKHKVKQLVAMTIDPTRRGIGVGYTTRIVVPGKYEVGKQPRLEVSYFDPQLQGQQYAEAVSAASAELDSSGNLIKIIPTRQVSQVLFYPPGIEVQHQPGDINTGSTANAVVLTGLAVNPAPFPSAGSWRLKDALADWLADSQSGSDSRVLSALNRYFTKRNASDDFDNARRAARQFVLDMADSTAFATGCGNLLEHLVRNVWARERFWKSSYLQTLSAYDVPATTVPELQALYTYAMKLRDQAPVKATSKSKSAAVLQAAIQPVYEYYRDNEIARLKREGTFRVQEAMIGVEFDFTANVLVEKTLSTLLTNNSDTTTAVVQALLETFACLEPTVMPDLLFGVRKIGTAAEIFSIRLGPWQIRDSSALNKFRVVVPVLGGTYYQRATGELQVLNDVHSRELNIEYHADFFAKVYKAPSYELLSSDLDASKYLSLRTATEQINPLAPATNYPYTGH